MPQIYSSNTFTCVFLSIIAPFSSEIGTEIQGTLDQRQSRIVQVPFPADTGMTLMFSVPEGFLEVLGSFSIQNPTALTADFRFVSSPINRMINEFISPELYQRATTQQQGNTRRRRRQTTDPNLFLTLTGLATSNSFAFDTGLGDTRPPCDCRQRMLTVVCETIRQRGMTSLPASCSGAIQ